MRKLLLLGCVAALTGMAAEIYTFDVPNSTTTTDSSGLEVSGWGYAIANESDSLWLVLTNLSAGSFHFADPVSLFDFSIVAPGQTTMEPYDQLMPAGLYQITWHADAPSGFVNSGIFSVMAEWWNGDPLASGSFVSSAPGSSQSYSVSASAVPEPATGVLVLLALLLITFGNSAARHLITHKRRA